MTQSTTNQPETHVKSTPKQRLIASLLLFIAAILWGSGFIPQKIGADEMPAFAFNGFRYFGAGLLVLILAKGKLPREKSAVLKTAASATVLFIAGTMQQVGIRYTSAGTAGFITTLYIVLVPFVSAVFLRTRLEKRTLLAAGFALVGLYLLATGGRGFEKFNYGDIIVFIGAIFWAVHMLVMKNAVKNLDPISFSSLQFLFAGAFNLIAWVIFDHADMEPVLRNIPLLLYSGGVVIAGGFTLQALGLKHADASHAANILGLESVFGMLFSIVLLGEKPLPLQFVGCALIFVATLLTAGVSDGAETDPAGGIETKNTLQSNQPQSSLE